LLSGLPSSEAPSSQTEVPSNANAMPLPQ
jgi:hypothetical protein